MSINASGVKDFFHRLKNEGGSFELMRFVLVGGSATVVDLTVSAVCLIFASWHENAATTIGFICAYGVSYFGHRSFTFHKNGSPLKFLLLQLFALGIRNLLIVILKEVIGIHGMPAIIIALVIVTVMVYTVSKFKIFNSSLSK